MMGNEKKNLWSCGVGVPKEGGGERRDQKGEVLERRENDLVF